MPINVNYLLLALMYVDFVNLKVMFIYHRKVKLLWTEGTLCPMSFSIPLTTCIQNVMIIG